MELNEVFANFSKTAGELIKAIEEAVFSISGIELACAYLWAKEIHPEWVAIMNRTKKKRIRKKYKDRILREYKKKTA